MAALLLTAGCASDQTGHQTSPPQVTLRSALEAFPDSFELDAIKVYSSFKTQILANGEAGIDSQRIVREVYHRHRELWEACYGTIFGPDNAHLFRTDTGMVAWNRALYETDSLYLDSLAGRLLEQHADSVFRFHIERFKQLDYAMPSAKISLAFTPLVAVGFGGCGNDQFVFELNNPEYELMYTLTKGFPHELYHLINGEQAPQPEAFTALDLTITEGLACYFTYTYFEGGISKQEAVEEMTADEWSYYEEHELEIFTRMQAYFDDTSGDNPLLSNKKYQAFPDAPKSLYYWLGFRIVETYLKNHPGTTIRELTRMPYREIFAGSGYTGRGAAECG